MGHWLRIIHAPRRLGSIKLALRRIHSTIFTLTEIVRVNCEKYASQDFWIKPKLVLALPWIRVSKVGLLISQLLLDGWVGGEERRLWQNEQPTSFWCDCQPVKMIRPCRSMVRIRKSFCTARRVTTTTNNSRQ